MVQANFSIFTTPQRVPATASYSGRVKGERAARIGTACMDYARIVADTLQAGLNDPIFEEMLREAGFTLVGLKNRRMRLVALGARFRNIDAMRAPDQWLLFREDIELIQQALIRTVPQTLEGKATNEDGWGMQHDVVMAWNEQVDIRGWDRSQKVLFS